MSYCPIVWDTQKNKAIASENRQALTKLDDQLPS
jgi:hypothetical protein